MKETILAIDIGSSKIATIIANVQDKNVDILGFSISNSFGIKKGSIVDIEESYLSIKNSIAEAKKNSPVDINRTIITLSSKDSLNIKSSGKINLPEKIITTREINQVLQTAHYNSTIPYEYEMIQVIPKNFIVDNVPVINPLNSHANILEVQTNIIVVKKNLIANLRNIFTRLNLNNLNFVLNSYSIIHSLTNANQRKNGVAIVNIGAETSELIYLKDNSYLFNSFIPVGSKNITNDLSLMLNIPTEIAEGIKLKYGNLLKDYKSLDNSESVLKLEYLEENLNLSNVQIIIHARVEELLILLKNRLKSSGCISDLKDGIIITGGLANLTGIKELAQKVFEGIPISLPYPTNFQNRFVNLEEHTLSSIIGALNYVINLENRFELDSNKKLLSSVNNEFKQKENNKSQESMNQQEIKLSPLEKKIDLKVSNLYRRIIELF